MAIVETYEIDPSNVKCRWEEPYVSDAVNKMLTALPLGIYRGFHLEPLATPGSGFRLAVDSTTGDSVLVSRDRSTGHTTVVRFDTDIDMTFTFTVSTDYYVWCEVDYAVSSATTASIKVGEVADWSAAGASAVVIGKFNSSDSTIDSSDILATNEWDYKGISAPLPDSGYNKWGLIDANYLSYLPSENQKDAMVGASPAPSASNPFVTESGLSKRVTYVVSDGTHTTNGDYVGADALEQAMNALEAAGISGDIYVRRGDYVLSGDKTYSVSMRIYGEGASHGSSGTYSSVDLVSYSLTFGGETEIHGMEFHASGASSGLIFTGRPTLVDVMLRVYCAVQNASGVGHFVSCAIRDANLSISGVQEGCVFDGCEFRADTNGHCVIIEGTCYAVTFRNCFFDGAGFFSTAHDGGGIICTGAADIMNLVIEDSFIWQRGAYFALYLGGTSVRNVAIRGVNVYQESAWGSVSSNHIVTLNHNDVGYLTVDGLVVTVDHSSTIDCGLLGVWAADAGGNQNTSVSVRNVQIKGNGNIVENTAALDEGVVTVSSNISSSYATITVDNLGISGFRGNASGTSAGILLALVSGAGTTGTTRINVQGLNIHLLDGAAPSTDAYCVGVSVQLGGGDITLDGCTIDGHELSAPTAGTAYYNGVVVRNSAATETGVFRLLNSVVWGWAAVDVDVIFAGGGHERVELNGVRGVGFAGMSNGTNDARIHLSGTSHFQVANCYFNDNSSGVSSATWCRIDGVSVYAGTIMGNQVIMANAGDDAIYVSDIAGKLTFFGNGGTGTINVSGADNHLGLGDGDVGDHNANTLSVNFR